METVMIADAGAVLLAVATLFMVWGCARLSVAWFTRQYRHPNRLDDDQWETVLNRACNLPTPHHAERFIRQFAEQAPYHPESLIEMGDERVENSRYLLWLEDNTFAKTRWPR